MYFPTLDQYKLSPAIAVQAVEGAPVLASVPGTVYSIEEKCPDWYNGDDGDRKRVSGDLWTADRFDGAGRRYS